MSVYLIEPALFVVRVLMKPMINSLSETLYTGKGPLIPVRLTSSFPVPSLITVLVATSEAPAVVFLTEMAAFLREAVNEEADRSQE